MATAFDNRREGPVLRGQCDCDGRDVPVVITELCAEGCVLEAGESWAAASDFAHLRIAGELGVNGRVGQVQGRRAQMRFFGQLHPAAIDKLLSDASL